MKNKLTQPTKSELEHSLNKQKIEAGFFGKLFGMGDAAKIHITGLLLIILLLSGVIFSFIKDFDQTKEYWATILPMITLFSGYIWGKNSIM